MQLSQKENRENFIVLLFHFLYAIHTKYTYKFFSKYDRETREPVKEANTAWNRKLCYLINNYNLQLIFWAGESSFMFILLQPPSLWRFREQKHSRPRRKLLLCRLIKTLSNQDNTSFLPSQRRSFSFSYFVDHNDIVVLAKF